MISVLMSVKDDSHNLPRAIDSIISQTHTDFEFLINDDGSADKSLEIIYSYADKDERIKVYKNDLNIGLTKSLNKLISFSSGDYIARQDSDDYSEENRFEIQLKVLRESGFDACTTRARIIGSNRKIPNLSFYIPNKLAIKYKNPFIHGSLLINKKTLSVLGNYNEKFYYAQDYKLFTDLIDNGYKVKNLNMPLYNLNILNNISTKHLKEQDYYAECVRRKIKL